MRVVIVGSGLAGVTLAGALPPHQVTLVTSEAQGYYSRPRLSHGVALDDAANEAGNARISAAASRVDTYAWTTDEECVIARHCAQILDSAAS